MPQRGPKRELLDTVARNAAEALALHKTKRASDLGTRGRALEELQQSLAMASAPLRIEGFDISHLQGTEVVGSMVVFEDGLARKSEYRRFVIKSFKGSNDIAAMDARPGERRVHRHGIVAAGEQKAEHAVARPVRTIRGAHHGNAAGAEEKVADLGIGRLGHGVVLTGGIWGRREQERARGSELPRAPSFF